MLIRNLAQCCRETTIQSNFSDLTTLPYPTQSPADTKEQTYQRRETEIFFFTAEVCSKAVCGTCPPLSSPTDASAKLAFVGLYFVSELGLVHGSQ